MCRLARVLCADVPVSLPQTSDSGAAGGDSCMSGAASGKASSSSHEQDQQTSGQQQQSSGKQQQQRLQRTATATSADATAAGRSAAAASQPSAAAPAAVHSTAGGSSGKLVKIPKLPMVQYGKKWYRAKVLKDAGSKVMLEYQGFSHEGGPFWLARDHARIWRGSYKGKDWRYLVGCCLRSTAMITATAAGGNEK